MRYQSYLSRLGKLDPAIKPNLCGPSFEGLSEAEMDKQIAHWIRDFERDGIQPDYLYKVDPVVCDSCSANFRDICCYTWIGDELRLCSPVEAEGYNEA